MEMLEAASQLAEQTGMDEQVLTRIMSQALVETYRKLVADDGTVQARIDLRTGTQELFRIENGEEIPLPPLRGDAARQAAQAIRRAVLEKTRVAGVQKLLVEASLRRGELVDGKVESAVGRTVLLRVADYEAVLPPEQQAEGERLQPRQHIKVVILEGRMRGQDAVMVVSRTHPALLPRLMQQEIPELVNGQIGIRAVAREPGRRSKVAVESHDPDIDAQGACIGPKGVRHRAITTELGGEQLQIVRWSDDPAQLVAAAIAPATVKRVTLDEATHTASVFVDSGQLSLAIGKGGENARIAAKLCGWRIDVHPDEP